MDPFPIKSAEIKQTLPQMFPFSKAVGCITCGVASLTRTTSENKFKRYFKKQRNDATVPQEHWGEFI